MGDSGCCRSLDLTGPLLLGGVPTLPESFPIRSRQFVGCMRHLHIDQRPVDMAAFIANNGTLPGADMGGTGLGSGGCVPWVWGQEVRGCQGWRGVIGMWGWGPQGSQCSLGVGLGQRGMGWDVGLGVAPCHSDNGLGDLGTQCPRVSVSLGHGDVGLGVPGCGAGWGDRGPW